MDPKSDILNISKPLGGRPHPTGLSTVLQMLGTKTELCNNWAISRALIGREPRSICTDKSTDHGSDVMVAQFVFLFLARAIFRETSTEMEMWKNVTVIVKKQSTTIFFCLYADRPSKWRQNVQNVRVKPLVCGSWFHLSFEHFDVISMFDKSTRVQPWKIVVSLLSRDKKGLTTDISKVGFADWNFHIILYFNCVICYFVLSTSSRQIQDLQWQHL